MTKQPDVLTSAVAVEVDNAEDKNPKGKMTPFRAWSITILLALFLFINYADKAVLGLAGSDIKVDLGLTAAQYGVIQSGFYWLFAVGAITLGALSSKINLRWYLAILMLVWVATMIPLLGAIGFSGLLICRVILGFAVGPAYALANHSAQSLFPADKRALASGVVTAGSSLGPLVMAPILTWIIVQWDWHTAFAVIAAAGIVWAVLWLIFGGSSKVESKVKPGQEATAEAKIAAKAEKSAKAKDGEPANVPYRVLLGTATIIGIAALNFFSYWSTSLKVAWLPVYLADGLGYDTLAVGRLVALPFATAAVFSIAAGFFSNWLYKRGFSRRVSRGYLAGALVAGAGLSMWGFTVIPQGVFQMVLVILAFSLNTASIGVGFTALGDLVHSKKRGAIMGGIVAISSLAGILSPLFLGWTITDGATAVEGYEKGFALVGIMMVVGAIVATFFIRPDKDLIKLRAWADQHASEDKETVS